MAVEQVRVPQKDGEVRIRVAGGEPLTFTVKEHLVQPRDDQERALLLASISGAKPAPSGK